MGRESTQKLSVGWESTEAREQLAGFRGELVLVRQVEARNLFETWDLEPLLILNPKSSVLYQRPSVNGRVAKQNLRNRIECGLGIYRGA